MATVRISDFTSAEFCKPAYAKEATNGILSSSANWHFTTPEIVRTDRQFALNYWSRLCDLPSAGSMRCHTPSFGIRFLDEADVVGGASICWECNNVFLRFRDTDVTLTFGGESNAAQQLLAKTKQLFDNA